ACDESTASTCSRTARASGRGIALSADGEGHRARRLLLHRKVNRALGLLFKRRGMLDSADNPDDLSPAGLVGVRQIDKRDALAHRIFAGPIHPGGTLINYDHGRRVRGVAFGERA